MSSQCRQPANILHPNFWFVAGEDAVRPRARKTEKLRERGGELEETLKALHNSG
jgi:hypothetical protein